MGLVSGSVFGRIPVHYDFGGNSVFQVSISQQQSLSSRYLQRLSQNVTGRFQLVDSSLLLSEQPIQGETQTQDNKAFEIAQQNTRLLIFAEGLNLEKLYEVQQTLADHIEFFDFSLKAGLASDPSQVCILVRIATNNQNTLASVIENAAIQHQVELVVLTNPPKLSEPGLLLMDMDSTVIQMECIDEIANLAGVGEQVSEVTELAMQGKLDFAESLHNRVACLKGAPENILTEVRNALPLMSGLTHLVNVLKANGWKVAIASGGFTYFADYLRERLEMDAAIANTLEIADGCLTGHVVGAIVDANVKAETLEQLAENWQISASQTVAMGDGANDLVMMKRAALGVAYHAKPVVHQQAAASIRFTGLDSLLWMLAE